MILHVVLGYRSRLIFFLGYIWTSDQRRQMETSLLVSLFFLFRAVDQWLLSLQNKELNERDVKTSGIITLRCIQLIYTNSSFVEQRNKWD